MRYLLFLLIIIISQWAPFTLADDSIYDYPIMTKGHQLACRTREDLLAAYKFSRQNDHEAIARLVLAGRCSINAEERVVFLIEDHSDRHLVKVRQKGRIEELWMLTSSLLISDLPEFKKGQERIAALQKELENVKKKAAEVEQLFKGNQAAPAPIHAVSAGMTYEEVKTILGKPWRINLKNGSGQACFSPDYCVQFEKDKATSMWEERQNPKVFW